MVQVFPVNFARFLKTRFLQKTSERIFLLQINVDLKSNIAPVNILTGKSKIKKMKKKSRKKNERR